MTVTLLWGALVGVGVALVDGVFSFTGEVDSSLGSSVAVPPSLTLAAWIASKNSVAISGVLKRMANVSALGVSASEWSMAAQ